MIRANGFRKIEPPLLTRPTELTECTSTGAIIAAIKLEGKPAEFSRAAPHLLASEPPWQYNTEGKRESAFSVTERITAPMVSPETYGGQV